MGRVMEENGVKLTDGQVRRRRRRSIALGLVLGGLVLLVYLVTIAKFGPNVLDRPL